MKKILLVEDEKMLSDMYKDKFEYEGFDIITAFDGEEALKIALKEEPDLILLDLLLPKKEGVDVLKEIRESGDWGKRTKIVMLTNLDTSDYILHAVEKYSPSYYFVKANVELNEVVEKVKEILE